MRQYRYRYKLMQQAAAQKSPRRTDPPGRPSTDFVMSRMSPDGLWRQPTIHKVGGDLTACTCRRVDQGPSSSAEETLPQLRKSFETLLVRLFIQSSVRAHASALGSPLSFDRARRKTAAPLRSVALCVVLLALSCWAGVACASHFSAAAHGSCT